VALNVDGRVEGAANSDLRNDDKSIMSDTGRAVVRRHPEDGTIIRAQTGVCCPAVEIDSNGAEIAVGVALGDADREPAVELGAGHNMEEGWVGAADVRTERCGLLVRGWHLQGIICVAIDGVDVLGVAGETETEAIGGAVAVGGGLHHSSHDISLGAIHRPVGCTVVDGLTKVGQQQH
jgi:hypothetical protein